MFGFGTHLRPITGSSDASVHPKSHVGRNSYI
jgi:hypothetical protein